MTPPESHPGNSGGVADAPLLAAQGLGMRYGGTVALAEVGFTLQAGECLALCGENGAGKSTLIKILGGLIPQGTYDGGFSWEGREARFRNPRDSRDVGIRVIHQELALAPDLSVAANLFLGEELRRGPLLDESAMRREARALLTRLEMDALDVDSPLGRYPVGDRQMLEIARAMRKRAKLLILDEPTSALSLREVERLFAVLADLKSEGCAFLYVSHRMDEVFRAADRICVLRNGHWVEERPASEWTLESLGSAVVGKRLGDIFPPRPESPAGAGSLAGSHGFSAPPAPSATSSSATSAPSPEFSAGAGAKPLSPPASSPMLRTRRWCVPDTSRPTGFAVEDLELELHAGEIVGLFGLLGSGRTEILESLFGLRPGFDRDAASGFSAPTGPAQAWSRGMAFLPEDRRGLGLMLERPIRENIALAAWARSGALISLVDSRWENGLAQEQIETLGIKAAGSEAPVGSLSGGNQQKVLLGKCLALKPRLLFLDDPTRGVDVGAKAEIYRIIRACADSGTAILIASSENEEILGLCDRFHILRQGQAGQPCRPADWTLESAFTLAAQAVQTVRPSPTEPSAAATGSSPQPRTSSPETSA